MSANTTPDAWKELTQLLETRKQVLDNALLRTLDDKCPAGYFQVARSLMLDHEKMLHWFIAQQNTGQERVTTPAASNIVKPVAPPLKSLEKRAGFIKPGLLAFLALVFFFVLILIALIQGNQPDWNWYDQKAEQHLEVDAVPMVLAHHLHFPDYTFQHLQKCCIMEKSNDIERKIAQSPEMDDASTTARSADTHQNRIVACDQSVPHLAGT